jgi:hypothetical protein
MSKTYEQIKIQMQQSIIYKLISTLDRAAMIFAQYETHHAEKGAFDKSTANGEYKQMCLDAIKGATENDVQNKLRKDNC